MLLQYGLLALALTGCREKPDIDWSTQAYSPDKHWLVTAKREAGGGGFGGGYATTTIYLKQAEQQPIEVLGLDRILDKSELHVTWSGPRRLEIRVDPGAYPIKPTEVLFQAIKCGDVTIDLETSTHQSSSPTDRDKAQP